jgi:hypothetical protein
VPLTFFVGSTWLLYHFLYKELDQIDDKASHLDMGQEYFDYKTPPNMFSLIKKNDDDQFPLKVVKKE